MAICFAGVMMIAFSRGQQEQHVTSGYPKIVGVLLAFCTAWFYAATSIMNRRLKDVHFTVLGFWHPVVGFVFALSYVLV